MLDYLSAADRARVERVAAVVTLAIGAAMIAVPIASLLAIGTAL